MRPYDELPWWCQLLWPWFGPPWYEQAEDPDVCLTAYWCALHLSAAELTELVSGDHQLREEFLAKAARLIAAHHQIEKTIRYHHASLAADDEADSDIDEPAPAGERSLVIGRDHPAWAAVDAEQRERLGEHNEQETP